MLHSVVGTEILREPTTALLGREVAHDFSLGILCHLCQVCRRMKPRTGQWTQIGLMATDLP
jgi:hypothetical protein